ncbi:MAG: hypothetical protein M3165_10425 [Actinomycetota bacterium]|nr:hypothetical protein [Actinomycetota bacterium]
MTLSELTWTLTALAGVVVLLTRIRLGSDSRRPAGRMDFSKSVLNIHTGAGVVALLLWVPGLVLDIAPVVLGGLGAWWVVTVAGLLLLARWLPAHGKHAGEAVGDEWTEGPWLSMLAHLGMLGGALYFSWAVLAHAT